MFCVSCGKEIEDGAQFCGFCGAKQPTEDAPRPQAAPVMQTAVPPMPAQTAAQKKPMPAGVKVLLIAAVVLSALFFGAKEVVNRIYSPDKTIDSFIEAVRARDGAALRAVTVVRAGEAELDDAALKPFFAAFATNDRALAEMRSTLEADARKLDGGSAASGDSFVRLKGEKRLLIVPSYTVEVTLPSVRVTSEFDDTTVKLGDKDVAAGTRAVELALLPGFYAVDASCAAPGTGARLTSAFDLTLCPDGYEDCFENADARSVGISFDYVSAYLSGDAGVTLESVTIDGAPCDLRVFGSDLRQGVTLTPVRADSVIEVKASADGEAYTQTFHRSENDRFYISAPATVTTAPTDSTPQPTTPVATADSPAFLWNNAAEAVANANLLGSTLREAAEAGWAGEWITLYYYDASDPDPAYVTARTYDIPLSEWLERYVTYSGASAAGWGDVWLSLVVGEASAADASDVQSRFLTFVEHCDSRYFTSADMEGFDATMAMLARNAPYAHAGRKFTNQVIAAFFEQFSWYHPTIEPAAFAETMLNDCETANKNLAVEYERAMGYK